MSRFNRNLGEMNPMIGEQTIAKTLLGTLDDAIETIKGIGGFEAESSRLIELSERVLSGQFHLAVLGQFKRGKSTLLNALLGQDILPTAIVPATAIPTWISTGLTARVQVDFANAARIEEIANTDAAGVSNFLSQFVTESNNPKNRLGVSKVRLEYPSSILTGGLVLIDTPGIGSTFQHNTKTTLDFLPQCDAALFLVSVDPPITGTEIEFLRQVCAHVSRVFFALNKVDYLSSSQVEESVQFFRKAIIEQAGVPPDVPIFPISAKLGLKARTTHDPALWRASGMEAVENYLINFLTKDKAECLRIAVQHKAVDVIEDVIMRLRLSLRAMQIPLDDLQSRLAILDRKIEELHREKQIAHDLLAGDERRMHESLEEEYKRICESEKTRLNQIVDQTLADQGIEHANGRALQSALNAAIPNLFDARFKIVIRDFDARLAEILQSHQKRLDSLVESIRETAADVFDIPYRPPSRSSTLKQTREPFWETHRWDQGFGPISPSMMEKLVPAALRLRRVERRFREKIEWLVLNNTGRLREVLYDQIDKAFSQFSRDLTERLAATVQSTQGATKAAMMMRSDRAEAVTGEAARLEAIVGILAEIVARFARDDWS
jgi:tRNA U34 5-carboxymethylaminomethyl modifying GTPase MnmE/TrmE